MLTGNNTLFMGIDGGGTKCRVRIESSSGQLLGIGLGGTANPSQGISTVAKSIITATQMALAKANLPISTMENIVVGAGLAGLHLPQYHQLMASWNHPFKALFLTDDLQTALLGAHQGNEGAVVIVGTGFSAMSLVNGEKSSIGGYGFLMADYCSGSWIGHQAVQAALLDIDNLAEKTLLTAMLEETFNGRGCQLANALVAATPKDYGEIAPLVFLAAEKQDFVALKILHQSREFIVRVIDLLAKTNPERISLVGGIAEQLKPSFNWDFLNRLSQPIQSPEQGAIHFAKAQYQIGNNAFKTALFTKEL
jgi:glucosamine kinase